MSQRPTPPRGYVATGPGFYVWEETRREAFRAARELGPRDPSAVRVELAGGKARPGRLRRPPRPR